MLSHFITLQRNNDNFNIFFLHNPAQRKGNFKKIPEIFDNNFDLKSLYPKSELTGFNSVMCMYFMQTKEFKTDVVDQKWRKT
jgi:hypothetical protein